MRKTARHREGILYSGAWKVAFADFVLALMCLFLVLWVLSQRDQENLEQILHSASASALWTGTKSRIDYQGRPRGSLIAHEPMPGQLSHKEMGKVPAALLDKNGRLIRHRYDSAASMEKLAGRLADLSADAGLASNIQTVITPYGLRVLLHDTDRQGMFERGSEVINERFKQLLQKIGEMFMTIDNQMLVVGHTDSSQYKQKSYEAFSNWSLSSNRAMAARAYLLRGGMSNHGILQVVGMADRAPLDPAHPADAINRRIELLILTTAQANDLSNMFGMPKQTQTLSPGIEAVLPDTQAKPVPPSTSSGGLNHIKNSG